MCTEELNGRLRRMVYIFVSLFVVMSPVYSPASPLVHSKLTKIYTRAHLSDELLTIKSAPSITPKSPKF